MKRQYWIIGGLIAVAAGLLYFLLHEPKPIDSHTADYDKVVADNKAFQQREIEKLKLIDSLQKDVTKRDTLIGELKSKLSGTRRDLDRSTAKAVQLATEIKQLKGLDTTVLGRKADSLASEAIEYAWLYNQYKANSDSLAAVVDKNNEDYVKALEERRKLYDELKRQHNELLESYKALFADYAKSQKTVRRERLKTKIAALLALVGGAAAVLK
jgi:chromosome segregation ATPase